MTGSVVSGDAEPVLAVRMLLDTADSLDANGLSVPAEDIREAIGRLTHEPTAATRVSGDVEAARCGNCYQIITFADAHACVHVGVPRPCIRARGMEAEWTRVVDQAHAENLGGKHCNGFCEACADALLVIQRATPAPPTAATRDALAKVLRERHRSNDYVFNSADLAHAIIDALPGISASVDDDPPPLLCLTWGCGHRRERHDSFGHCNEECGCTSFLRDLNRPDTLPGNLAAALARAETAEADLAALKTDIERLCGDVWRVGCDCGHTVVCHVDGAGCIGGLSLCPCNRSWPSIVGDRLRALLAAEGETT